MLAALPSPSSRATAFTRMTTGNATLMGRHGGDPHALAHKDLVHDVVEAVDHQRQGRGDGVADDQLLNRLGFQRAAGLLIGRHTDPSSGGRTARRDKKSQRQSTALPTG